MTNFKQATMNGPRVYKTILPAATAGLEAATFRASPQDRVLNLLKAKKPGDARAKAKAVIEELACLPGCGSICLDMNKAAIRGDKYKFTLATIALQAHLRELGFSPRRTKLAGSQLATATCLLASDSHLAKVPNLNAIGAAGAFISAQKSAMLSKVHLFLGFDEMFHAVQAPLVDAIAKGTKPAPATMPAMPPQTIAWLMLAPAHTRMQQADVFSRTAQSVGRQPPPEMPRALAGAQPTWDSDPRPPTPQEAAARSASPNSTLTPVKARQAARIYLGKDGREISADQYKNSLVNPAGEVVMSPRSAAREIQGRHRLSRTRGAGLIKGKSWIRNAQKARRTASSDPT